MTQLALLTALLFTAGLGATPLSSSLPEDTEILSLGTKPSVSWVLTSLKEKDCSLLLDPIGKPWLSCKGHFLSGPYYAVLYTVEKQLDGAAWPGAGGLLALVDGDLGTLSVEEALKGGHSLERIEFKRLAHFPEDHPVLTAGYGGSAYIVGHDGQSRGDDVFAVRHSTSGWQTTGAASSPERVTAVAGDGSLTFMALGRSVVVTRLSSGGSGARQSVLFTHPDADITALEYSPKLGLFYATKQGVGYIGNNYNFEFMKSPQTQIKLRGSSLYVMLSNGRGVLKVEGIDVFSYIGHRLFANEPGKGQRGIRKQ